MKAPQSIASALVLAMTPLWVSAQSPAEAGLVVEDLVVAGFTATTAQLVLDRLDDEDVRDAWTAVTATRASLAEAQSTCMTLRHALTADPSNDSCQTAHTSAQNGVAAALNSLNEAVLSFEALLFDQVEGTLLTELRRVRLQQHAVLPPEMSALDWGDAEMGSLAAALIEERRCLRREEEIGDASETLLADARSDQAVTAAETRLGTHLAGVAAAIENAQ